MKETWKTLNESLDGNTINKPKINTLIINKKETRVLSSRNRNRPEQSLHRYSEMVFPKNSTEMELITEIPSVNNYVSSINLGGESSSSKKSVHASRMYETKYLHLELCYSLSLFHLENSRKI